MQYALMINLNYDLHDRETCKQVWSEIERGMTLAGFAKHKRLFLSSQDRVATCERAQAIVSEVEARFASDNPTLFDLIGEFYCFEYLQINDLLDPIHHEPIVAFLDDDEFSSALVVS